MNKSLTNYCKTCKETKPCVEFHKRASNPNGLKEACKDCVRVLSRSYYQRNRDKLIEKSLIDLQMNPERHKEYNRKHRENNRDKYSKYSIALRRKKNGFTEELFNYLMKLQGGQCAICSIKLSTGLNETSASADHDHQALKPRGILCKRCNLMLGHAKDDVTRLAKAIEYLEYWRTA